MKMDAFFAPICVITMVCLLLECFSLLLGNSDFALSCRFIILMLVYLAYVLKRDLVQRALKKKRCKLLYLHNYVLFLCCTVGTIFHSILLCFLPFRPYCLCAILSSFPIALDEYLEIEWLKERERSNQQEEEVELRSSLYYSVYVTIVSYKPRTILKDESLSAV